MARGEIHDVVVATHGIIGYVLAIALAVAEGRQVWRARCYGPEKNDVIIMPFPLSYMIFTLPFHLSIYISI